MDRLIIYSTEQQIFKLKANFGTNQELLEFMLILNQINPNGQLMLFYSIWFFSPTENPYLAMRQNLKENLVNILLCVRMIYILHQLLKKFFIHDKTNIRSIFIYKINIHMIQVEEIFINSRNIRKSYMKM